MGDKKKSPPKKRRKSTPGITKTKYDEMLAAYIERESIAHVARTCGVSHTTARKYVNQGNKRRGLVAIKDRVRVIRETQSAKEDYDIAKARAETRTMARALQRKIALAIKDLDQDDLSADKLAEHLSKVHALIERTFGGADQTVEVRGALSHLTVEELERYIKEGVMPPGE